jgi:trans-aconitate 2-methyltransferase
MLAQLQLSSNERVVDLGCGTGEHTVELARRSGQGRVLGIDSSPAMIERARKLHATLNPDLRQRVAFELADFRNFTADQAYSVIFSNAALQWVSDHRGVLAACYRALTPGGRLMVQMPANENEAAQATMRAIALEPAWSDWLGGIKTPSDENVRGPAEYRAMLAEIGFANVDCSYHVFRHPMRNASEVVEFCRSTSLRRFLDPLPPARQSEFGAELTRRLEQSYGTSGAVIFNFRRLFLWGWRLDA